MKPRYTIFIWSISFMLGIPSWSLAQKVTLPNWVENPSSVYNPKEYLLAVGSGSSLQNAQNKALGNLTRIFQSKVKSSQKLIDEFQETSGNNRISSDRVTQLLSVTEIGSRQNLINAKILKTYKDNSGTFYALAGMKRHETARLYSAEISRNELKLNEYENRIKNEKDLLLRLGLVKKALILVKVNQNLKKQRDILLGRNMDVPEGKTRLHLEKEYQYLRKHSLIYLSAPNIPLAIQNAVTNALKDEGFILTNQADKAIIKAKLHYSYHEADLKRKDAYFIRWNFSIRMNDNHNGDRLKTFSLKGRDGGLSHNGAVLRSQQTLCTKIKHDFKEFIETELLKIN